MQQQAKSALARQRVFCALALLLFLAAVAHAEAPKPAPPAPGTNPNALLDRCLDSLAGRLPGAAMQFGPALKMVKAVPRWRGIPAAQHPGDMLVFQEIVTELRPDLIVETGTFMGGASLFLADVLERVNPQGRVVTIDINDFRQYGPCGRYLESTASFRDRIEFFLGSSVAPEVVKRVAERARGKRVLVTLDSNHEAPHVAKELDAYAPLVSVGSYLVVQDTYIGKEWGTNEPPIRAVREFLAAHPEFETDRSRERFAPTSCKDGFLKRVR